MSLPFQSGHVKIPLLYGRSIRDLLMTSLARLAVALPFRLGILFSDHPVSETTRRTPKCGLSDPARTQPPDRYRVYTSA